jgi:hypothetical protein
MEEAYAIENSNEKARKGPLYLNQNHLVSQDFINSPHGMRKFPDNSRLRSVKAGRLLAAP